MNKHIILAALFGLTALSNNGFVYAHKTADTPSDDDIEGMRPDPESNFEPQPNENDGPGKME